MAKNILVNMHEISPKHTSSLHFQVILTEVLRAEKEETEDVHVRLFDVTLLSG